MKPIAREFSYDLLAAIADHPEPELREALDRLTTAGLLFARGVPPHSTYLFKHALVQDAAYATLLRSRRQVLHARVAEQLQTQFPEIAGAQPELLAHHFTAALQPQRAIEYWLKAGRRALDRSAIAEAETLLRKALVVLANVPDSDWKFERELDLQLALGVTLRSANGGGAPAVGEAFGRAHEVAVSLEATEKRVPILFGLWEHHLMRAELQLAWQIAREAQRFGEARNDVVAQVAAANASGATCIYLGDFQGAHVHLERGLGLFDPAQRLAYEMLRPEDPLVVALTVSAYALVYIGYPDRARGRRDAAIAEARQLGNLTWLVFAIQLGLDAARNARWDARERLQQAEELLALSEQTGFGLWRLQAMAHRGWCLTALGRGDEGIPILNAVLTDWPGKGAIVGMPDFCTMLADAYRLAGQPQAGLTHLAEAERIPEAGQDRSMLAETVGLRGELVLLLGEHTAAERSFRRSLEIAREQGAKLFELRSATRLAQLWRDQGRFADARKLLAPIWGWFTEGFDTKDLKEANALLCELSETVNRAIADSRVAPNLSAGR